MKKVTPHPSPSRLQLDLAGKLGMDIMNCVTRTGSLVEDDNERVNLSLSALAYCMVVVENCANAARPGTAEEFITLARESYGRLRERHRP